MIDWRTFNFFYSFTPFSLVLAHNSSNIYFMCTTFLIFLHPTLTKAKLVEIGRGKKMDKDKCCMAQGMAMMVWRSLCSRYHKYLNYYWIAMKTWYIQSWSAAEESFGYYSWRFLDQHHVVDIWLVFFSELPWHKFGTNIHVPLRILTFNLAPSPCKIFSFYTF